MPCATASLSSFSMGLFLTCLQFLGLLTCHAHLRTILATLMWSRGEKLVDVPAAQIRKQPIPPARSPARIGEHIVDGPDRLQQRTAEQIADLHSPLIQEEIVGRFSTLHKNELPIAPVRNFSTLQILERLVEVVKVIPQQRVQQRTEEHAAYLHVPQIQEEIAETIQRGPQERELDCTAEQPFDVPGPQNQKQMVGVGNVRLAQRTKNRSSTCQLLIFQQKLGRRSSSFRTNDFLVLPACRFRGETTKS